MLISDIVLEKELPPEVAADIEAYVGCIAGAILKDDYLQMMRDAGFENIEILSAANMVGGCGADDGTLEETCARLGIDAHKVKDHASCATSMQLRAIKP